MEMNGGFLVTKIKQLGDRIFEKILSEKNIDAFHDTGYRLSGICDTCRRMRNDSTLNSRLRASSNIRIYFCRTRKSSRMGVCGYVFNPRIQACNEKEPCNGLTLFSGFSLKKSKAAA